jgi:orotidine-5'-phosphate decarboxylase
VVGLDPTPELLPPGIRPRGTSPARLAEAYLRFGSAVVEGVAGVVPALKIQLACYERLGWRGVRAYEETLALARRAGLLVLADAKRGDVPHTAEHYARAYLGPSGADALTVNPLLGPDTLDPFVRACAESGGGIFVLVRTSNRGSTLLQGRAGDRGALCERLARAVARAGRALRGKNGWSAVGAVVGATHPREVARLRALLPRSILLLPGYGAQGAGPRDVARAFDPSGFGALVVAARRVLAAAARARDVEGAVRRATRDFVAEVSAAVTVRHG